MINFFSLLNTFNHNTNKNLFKNKKCKNKPGSVCFSKEQFKDISANTMKELSRFENVKLYELKNSITVLKTKKMTHPEDFNYNFISKSLDNKEVNYVLITYHNFK